MLEEQSNYHLIQIKQGDRDVLYQSRVNPVVNFPRQGVVLFGDKTVLTKPSVI